MIRRDDIEQGTDPWHEWRAGKLTGSNAPVIMDASPYKSRYQLLTEVVQEIQEEHDEDTLERFRLGHEYEEAARPLVAEQVSEADGKEVTLEAMCCEMEDDQFPSFASDHTKALLSGQMVASLDGLSQDGSYIFEHKSYNKKLAEQVQQGALPDHIRWQLEHNLLVSGAKTAIFACSNGDMDSLIWTRYTSSRLDVVALLAGWTDYLEAKARHIETHGVISELEAHLMELDDQIEQASSKRNAIKSQLETLSGGMRISGDNYTLSWTSKPGTVNYSRLITAEDIDLSDVDIEKYRGKSTRFSTLKRKSK